MNNIFILTEGGHNLGMGHISRCLSLSQAFAEYGYSSTLIINGEVTVCVNLASISYIYLDWINNQSAVLSIVDNSDILIIDSYLCPEDLYEKLALISSTVVYIDDNIRIDYPKGVVINGVMCSEKMHYPRSNGVTYLLGQKYSFLRKEFWDVPDKLIHEHINSVLITCGGNDDGRLTYTILKSLVEVIPSVIKKIILKNIETPYLEYFKEHSIVLTDQTALEMRALMIESDIAITASGQTTYELCRCGTPFIAITTAENQLFSINCFHANGLVGIPISSDDQKMDTKILKELSILSDQSIRQSIHEKMKKSINGMGSMNVVAHLIKTLKNK